MTLTAWSKKLIIPQPDLEAAIQELQEMGLAGIVTASHGMVTIQSRRIQREEKKRESDRLRQERNRSHKSVTEQSQPRHGDIHIQKQKQKHIHIPEKSVLPHRIGDFGEAGFSQVVTTLKKILPDTELEPDLVIQPESGP